MQIYLGLAPDDQHCRVEQYLSEHAEFVYGYLHEYGVLEARNAAEKYMRLAALNLVARIALTTCAPVASFAPRPICRIHRETSLHVSSSQDHPRTEQRASAAVYP
jgi:hypothetical protein